MMASRGLDLFEAWREAEQLERIEWSLAHGPFEASPRISQALDARKLLAMNPKHLKPQHSHALRMLRMPGEDEAKAAGRAADSCCLASF